MKLQEAISILKIHQQWRLGADIVMIEPKELTEAIDTLLNYHIVDTNEMVSSQTEISDEEIEKGAENAWSDYEYEEGNLYSTTFKGGWKLAIKWYREQIKSRQ